MKEIVITSGRQRKEIIIFCLCMVMANIFYYRISDEVV